MPASVGGVSDAVGDIDGVVLAIEREQNKLNWIKITSYPSYVFSMSSHVASLHGVHF